MHSERVNIAAFLQTARLLAQPRATFKGDVPINEM